MKTNPFIHIISLLICLALSACGADPSIGADPTSKSTMVDQTDAPTAAPEVSPTETTIATATASNEEKKGVFLKKIYQSENGRTLPYQFLIPEYTSAGQRYPLLVFLHGAGELGSDNSTQTTNFPRHFLNLENSQAYPFFAVAPQCPATDAWASFPNYPTNAQTSANPTQATRLAIELIEQLLREYPIDADRVYVTGVSLGGEGTFDIVSRRPDLFAAAAPVCGIADVEKAPLMKDVPFWIFHGEKDTINPVEYSQQMALALQAAGATPRYTEYEGAGHAIWNQAYNEPDFLPWLFSQRKDR